MCLQVLGKTSAQAESTATGHGKVSMWSLRRKLKKEDTLFSVSFVFNSRSEKDAVAVGLYQNPNRSPAERIRFEKEEQGGGRMMSFLPQA